MKMFHTKVRVLGEKYYEEENQKMGRQCPVRGDVYMRMFCGRRRGRLREAGLLRHKEEKERERVSEEAGYDKAVRLR